MAATHKHDCTTASAPLLYMALELSAGTWKLAFTVGLGQKPRLKTVTARSTLGLLLEIKAAKKRFGLPEDAPVLSCYEAGRDGFWLHRFLVAQGIQNQVVDSASIEVNRRQRRAKSDGLDAAGRRQDMHRVILGHHSTVATAKIRVGRRFFQRQDGDGAVHLVRAG